MRTWIALVACTVSVFGCKEPASPDASPELIQDQPAVLQQGLNAYLIVSHTVQPVGGVVTANPALMTSGAAMAINGGASGTGNVLKSEDYYDISYGTDYDQGNMLPACDDAGCDVVDVG